MNMLNFVLRKYKTTDQNMKSYKMLAQVNDFYKKQGEWGAQHPSH